METSYLIILVMVSNFFSRDLGVDAAGSGVRTAGIRRDSPRDLVTADCEGSGWNAS